MPPSTNYTWSIIEYNALMERLASLESNRDFLALRGDFAYVANDGSGGAIGPEGGMVALTASSPHSYSLAAPTSEIARLELTNSSAVTHTVSVSDGKGFSSISLPAGSAIVLAASVDSKWYVQPRNATVS